MKTEGNCILCFKLMDGSSSDTVVDNAFFELLNFLSSQLNVSDVLGAPVCGSCVENVNDSYNFKSLCLENSKQSFDNDDINKQLENDSEKTAICRMCKNIVKENTCIPLLSILKDESMKEKMNCLLSYSDFQDAEDPLACDTCHTSLSNFYNVLTLLSIYDKIDSDIGMLEKDQIKEEDTIEINLTNETEVFAKKNGFEIINQYQYKHEEIDLKIDPEDPDFEEHWIEDQIMEIQVPAREAGDLIYRFTCDLCSYRTNRRGNLLRHMRSHESGEEANIYKCELCDFQTKLNYYLKRHMMVHKSDEEIEWYKCAQCTFQSKRKYDLKKHMILHKKLEEIEMFECQICKFQTKNQHYLKHHMKIHKSVDELEMHKCPQCGFQTKQKYGLKKHMIIHKTSDEIEMHKCTLCEYQGKRKSDVKRHLLTHEQKKRAEDKKHSCPVCTYKTNKKLHLSTHMLIHKKPDEIDMFSCQICGFRSKHKRGVRLHMKLHGNPEELQWFECFKCSFRTKYKCSLIRHVKDHNTATNTATTTTTTTTTKKTKIGSKTRKKVREF